MKNSTWKIFKSEAEYLKYVSTVAFLLVIIINLSWIAAGKFDDPEILRRSRNLVWLSLFLSFFAFYLGFYRKSFRLSIYAKLPVGRWQIAVSRMLLLLAFWAGILAIDLFFRALFSADITAADWIEYAVFLTGVVLIMDSVSFILQDVNSIFYNKIKRNVFNAVLGIIAVLIYLSFLFMDSLFDEMSRKLTDKPWVEITNFYFTNSGAISVFVVGLLLLLTSFFTFGKRKSFIE